MLLQWTYQSAFPLKKSFLTGQKVLSYYTSVQIVRPDNICVISDPSQGRPPPSHTAGEELPQVACGQIEGGTLSHVLTTFV